MEARSPWALRAALCLAATALTAHAQAADNVERKYTRKTTFALPFGAPRHGRDVPKEVHLHFSSDRGQTWQPYAQSAPDKKRFDFKASQDGEYWFMLRTKFASGQYLPAGRPAPELKVIVDTVPPALALDVREGEGGEVHLRWEISDPNLAAETFRLEYKTTDLQSTWQRVAIERGALRPGQTEYNGETTIVPLSNGAEHSLIVRADVADKAENHTAREQPLRLASAGPADTADGSAAGAPDGRETPNESDAADDAPPPMQSAFPQRESDTADRGADRSFPVLDSSQGPAFTPPNRRTLVPERVHPPVTRQHEQPPAADDAEPLAKDIHPRMSNKKQLELDYDIDSVGSARISEVELWCTRDGGHTWSALATDDDCRSPMRLSVEGEGLYGFRVVVATSSGVRSPEPAPGEPPDVWVEVDLTPPEARLISAEQGADGEADQLMIAWEADDLRLADRPVSLRYSEQADGEWTTIASGLENTGRYAWRLDERLPDRVYLRLEVRDEAGNITTIDSPDAIALVRGRPQSRIRDVHPVGILPPARRRLAPR